jgi:SAM-dependent methyltransferase
MQVIMDQKINPEKEKRIKEVVRERYGDIALDKAASCCGGESDTYDLIHPVKQSSLMGYTPEELASAPAESNLGLGCGNPQAIAALQEGEVVLDLGSGAGFDSFLAARQIGPKGKVIGVDMTPEMVTRARENAQKGSYSNVEFRLGEIEDLPVEENTIDVILSNCVINLSPDKNAVYQEAYRVLKPGGRLAISDMVASGELPPEIRNDMALYSACVAGALQVEELKNILEEAGFKEIKIQPKDESREFINKWTPGIPIEDYVLSATIEARK